MTGRLSPLARELIRAAYTSAAIACVVGLILITLRSFS